MTDLEDLRSRAARLEEESYRELWAMVVDSASALKEIAPNRRRPWLKNVVSELRALQGGRCALCGEPLGSSDVDVDHKIPFCYGGGNERGNIQLAHAPCNRRKRAAVDPSDLLRYLEDRYMNRPQQSPHS